MPTRFTLVLPAGLLAATLPFALSAAPAPGKAAPDKPAPTAKPERTLHPDGSVSIALDRPDHGLFASVGEDGRIRISCIEANHALLEKRAHERLHADDGTAWE